MRVIWSPPDPASQLKHNGVRYNAGDAVDLTDAEIKRLGAAWYVPVKRADLIDPSKPEALENSGVRSATVHVPVPVLTDPETGETVGAPAFDLDGVLEAAGIPGDANPKDQPGARKRRAPRS